MKFQKMVAAATLIMFTVLSIGGPFGSYEDEPWPDSL